MENTLAINSKLDRFGIVVSCVCALHCLAMPLFVVFLPFLGATFLADEMTEDLLLLMAFLIGISSLSSGYFLHHRRISPIALFSIGILLVLTGRSGFEESFWLETVLSGLGAILFAVSHFINYRLCKACCDVDETKGAENL